MGRPKVLAGPPAAPPATTALGALLSHITGGHLGAKTFQPMNVNFGLFPDVEFSKKTAEGNRLRGKDKAVAKKRAMTARALYDLQHWLHAYPAAAE